LLNLNYVFLDQNHDTIYTIFTQMCEGYNPLIEFFFST
jgi:hypothetical protein